MVTHRQAVRLVAKVRDPRNNATMVGGQLPFFKQFLNNARKRDLARRHRANMKLIQILRVTKNLPSNVQRTIINQLNLPHKTVVKAPPARRLAPSTINPLRGTTSRRGPSGRGTRRVHPSREP